MAEDTMYVPSLTYRTGPFASGGVPLANGFADYFNMLNERDGGIGGVKIVVEECETGYNAQKGVECYESTKGKGALVYNPYSTGITLQLIPKAPVDKIPVLSMGYGLSAAAIGEKFPWTFTYPTTYWSQLSSILKYIDADGGLKGKKIGFIYLDVGYGKEPIPLLEQLAKDHGLRNCQVPGRREGNAEPGLAVAERPQGTPRLHDHVGLGCDERHRCQGSCQDQVSAGQVHRQLVGRRTSDLRPVGEAGKGYKAANFSGIGTDFPALQDVIKHVVDKGKSQVASKDQVGDVLYNRGLFNSVLIAEGIRAAQAKTGKKVITGADLRDGFETVRSV
jgi:branched-chain amino acid transport system substrate-binding protein